MTGDDLAYMALTALARAIADRELSALEVTRHLVARVARLEPELGAYVAVLADSAEREAKAADSALARGQRLGPLHGVPIAVKDLCDASGTRTLAGMPSVRGNVAPATRDATVVARLRAAGAVLLGKLQLTEGAVAHHHPEVRPPRNPHNPDYWSGASSSGSGVAAASGLAYGTLGSDTGGSIRFPAFANGVTGLKPTWGRVSRAGVFPLAWSLDHIGPIARSAADCAALLGVIAGYDDADPTALAAPVPDYSSALVGDLRGLRVGFDADYATSNVDDAICGAMHDALETLRAAGATLVEVRFPDTAAVIESWFPLCTAEAAAAHAATFPSREADYGPELRELLSGGNATSGRDYALAHDLRQHFRGRVARVFGECDLLVVPSWMRQNLTLTEFAAFGSRESDWPELIRFTAPFDIAGTPTLSLPAGHNADGAPFGFQLVGPHLGETTLLRAGHAYQQATDWHRRFPVLDA